MKSPTRLLPALGCVAVVLWLAFTAANAATTNVFIDPAWPWHGFENVYYRSGAFWTNAYFAPGTTSLLCAGIDGAGTVACAPELRMDRDLHFDTNAWADATGSSTGICTVVSTFYADSTAIAAAGDTVVFSGVFAGSTLAAPYSNSIFAFIKDFGSNWTAYGMASVRLNTLTNGQRFTLTKTIAAPGPGNHVQWGFEWSGPPARTNTAASLGRAVLCPLPKPRGALVPWTTYEAEAMLASGGTILGPEYQPNLVAAEASGRKCARLDSTGQSLQFTASAPANALVIRYSVPDTADGQGSNYTLSLYTNGAFAQKLPVTSKYSWLYGAYPFTNWPAAGSPRNFFDEVRVAGLSISSNDVIQLKKDAGDAASYYLIDLVDTENVAVPLTQPANALAITAYGGVPDGITDCTAALRNCISAAQAQGKVVWLPAGAYLVTGNIDLPSGTTLQGAGMWHTRLTGSAALYNTTPSRRISLNGAGSNIHLADFAVFGCLNYRNDQEGNDGVGGSFGTGSTISRLWIEHTKAAAWILNSSGLVVEHCRFRNTLADGINLNRGMQGTLLTNCTARGTGDDCFAIWPSAGSASYPAAQNVITHCTGQTPFLANGGALYGGTSNRIEDCLFRDITYGCGILISTTFPVGSSFSGTTAVQRSDLIRCGGFDPGYQWRGALQICMDRYGGISGLGLDGLNITDSVSDGLSIIGRAGLLANTTATNVTIGGFGLGASGRHALWASAEAVGSMSVSNSVIPEFLNESRTFSFYFAPPPVPTILSASVSSGTNLVLKFCANPGTGYRVELTSDLLPPAWRGVPDCVTNASRNTATLAVPIPSGSSSQYFRIASP